MDLKDIQKECEKRAFDLIEQGATLNSFDLRIIARQVVKELLEGELDDKNSVSM